MKQNKLQTVKEDLGQDDFYDDEYIYKVSSKYSKLIGEFIIIFSELEHELDVKIAETFLDDDISVGYRVIKNLDFFNKTELFYEIHLEMATYMNHKNKLKLKIIKDNLDIIRIFRNKLVHANWSTLTKDGFVRTKIDSNKIEGNIQLIKVKILPTTIKKHIGIINNLIDKISDYKK